MRFYCRIFSVITCFALTLSCTGAEQPATPEPSPPESTSPKPSQAQAHPNTTVSNQPLASPPPASNGLPCMGEMAPQKNPIKPIGSDEYLRVQACMAYMALIESYVGLHEQGRLDGGSVDYEQGSLDYYIYNRMINQVRGAKSAENIERGMYCDCLAQPLDAFWDPDIPHPGVGPKSSK